MHGPDILVRTLTRPSVADRYGSLWQYHSRSDHHSKVACWGIVFDLMRHCALLRRHVAEGRVAFGINHEMRDFHHDRKKNLDLVLCTPAGAMAKKKPETLGTLAARWSIILTNEETIAFEQLPTLTEAPVGSVLMALEAKACMTAHQRALPRLYDELNSSHLTVHGSSEHAIAAAFVMINAAERYLSPDMNKRNRDSDPNWSDHRQPRDTEITIAKVLQLPRRSNTGDVGYDALAISVVHCVNDGSAVSLENEAPAPRPGDIHRYDSMIHRLANLYATRFKDI